MRVVEAGRENGDAAGRMGAGEVAKLGDAGSDPRFARHGLRSIFRALLVPTGEIGATHGSVG